jgi:hypothetical protein
VTYQRTLWRIFAAYPLDRYRAFLRRPGRWLYVPLEDDCPDHPVVARDQIDEVLAELPPRVGAELRRAVAPLDEEFRRRTIPNPRARYFSEWHAAAWWRQRMQEWPEPLVRPNGPVGTRGRRRR